MQPAIQSVVSKSIILDYVTEDYLFKNNKFTFMRSDAHVPRLELQAFPS